jgi:phage shock protein A
MRDLESKIRQASQKRQQLVARLHHASAVRQIHDSLESTTRGSALSQFRRLTQQVDRAEALNQAHARLLEHEPAGQELEEQFTEAERRERIERDYQELKRCVED